MTDALRGIGFFYPLTMKTIITFIILAAIGLAALSLSRKRSDKGTLPAFSRLLLDTSLSQAQVIAEANNKQLLVIIAEDISDPAAVLAQMGYEPDRLPQWQKSYRFLLLERGSAPALTLQEACYLQAYPASITFAKGFSQPDRVRYGFLIPGNRPNSLVTDLSQRLYQLYLAGDRDPRLVKQLLDHSTFLGMQGIEATDLRLRLTNDYLASFQREDFSTFQLYQELKGLCIDTRLVFVDSLLLEKDHYNTVFLQIVEDYNRKNPIDADWMIRQAIQKTLEQAVQERDESLYQHALATRDRWRPGYMNEWMAESIFRYQIRVGSLQEQRLAALQYFEHKDYYYSRQYGLLETAADIINTVATEPEEWVAAERWISKVIQQKANPTRYRLQLELCQKLDKAEQVEDISLKLASYRELFVAFLVLYPPAADANNLIPGNISKQEYDRLTGISSNYQEFTYYISRESSLFKRGEKIEAVALLSTSEEEIELLSRVHLETGSLLPVRHFRSYYIRSRFSHDGEHLYSRYERAD